MTAFADGLLFAEMCGIPELTTATKLVLHVWNKNNYLPEVKDVFSIWEAHASFKNVFLPPEPGALCRYGSPFRGGTNAIVRYEAGLGNQTGADNFVPITEVISLPLTLKVPVTTAADDNFCDIFLNLKKLGYDIS